MKNFLATTGSLLLGAIAVWAANHWLTTLSKPDLVLRLTLVANIPTPRLELLFVNLSDVDAHIAPADSSFVLPPFGKKQYTLYLRNTKSHNNRQPARLAGKNVLRVDNLLPALTALPRETILLSVVYQSEPDPDAETWSGFVESNVIELSMDTL